MPTIEEERRLAQIAADWVRLNSLDDIWTREIEVLRAAGPRYRDRNLFRDLGNLISDMQRLLDRIPPQSRLVLGVLEDNDTERIDSATDSIATDPDAPQEAREFARWCRDQGGPKTILARSVTRLSERSGEVSLEFESKRRSLSVGDLPPADLPLDVKCALVAALGLLGYMMGADPAEVVMATGMAMVAMSCFDVL